MNHRKILHQKGCPNKSCLINKYCSPQWFSFIHENKTILYFKKNNQIIHEGDPVTGIYFISTGKVKVHTTGSSGKEMILRMAKSGDIVGHRGFVRENYPISVTALEDTAVCFLEKEKFINALKNNSALTYNMLLFYMEELKKSEERTKNMAQKKVTERIADALLYLEEVFGTNDNGELNLPLSRIDLATMAGTVYETVIRTLQNFEKENLIKFRRKKLKIINREGLNAKSVQSAEENMLKAS